MISTAAAWLGFWLFVIVAVICDTWLFSRGYNTFFHGHKTDEEKELRQLTISQRRADVVKTYADAGYKPLSGFTPDIPGVKAGGDHGTD